MAAVVATEQSDRDDGRLDAPGIADGGGTGRRPAAGIVPVRNGGI